MFSLRKRWIVPRQFIRIFRDYFVKLVAGERERGQVVSDKLWTMQ